MNSKISNTAIREVPKYNESAPPRDAKKLKGDGNSSNSMVFFTCMLLKKMFTCETKWTVILNILSMHLPAESTVHLCKVIRCTFSVQVQCWSTNCVVHGIQVHEIPPFVGDVFVQILEPYHLSRLRGKLLPGPGRHWNICLWKKETLSFWLIRKFRYQFFSQKYVLTRSKV